jgi:hypothetical protein
MLHYTGEISAFLQRFRSTDVAMQQCKMRMAYIWPAGTMQS